MLYWKYKKEQKVMDNTDLISKAYKIIGDLTPLKTDCGRLCNAACCKGDDETGMLLFPGEDKLYENDPDFAVTKTIYGVPLLICRGKCERSKRPLSCRIFPLAIISKNGIIKVIPDPRSKPVCPLYRSAVNQRLDRDFVSAVKNVGKLLSESKDMCAFFEMTAEQCREYEVFFK